VPDREKGSALRRPFAAFRPKNCRSGAGYLEHRHVQSLRHARFGVHQRECILLAALYGWRLLARRQGVSLLHCPTAPGLQAAPDSGPGRGFLRLQPLSLENIAEFYTIA
jgi:hypothetical protein